MPLFYNVLIRHPTCNKRKMDNKDTCAAQDFWSRLQVGTTPRKWVVCTRNDWTKIRLNGLRNVIIYCPLLSMRCQVRGKCLGIMSEFASWVILSKNRRWNQKKIRLLAIIGVGESYLVVRPVRGDDFVKEERKWWIQACFDSVLHPPSHFLAIILVWYCSSACGGSFKTWQTGRSQEPKRPHRCVQTRNLRLHHQHEVIFYVFDIRLVIGNFC